MSRETKTHIQLAWLVASISALELQFLFAKEPKHVCTTWLTADIAVFAAHYNFYKQKKKNKCVQSAWPATGIAL